MRFGHVPALDAIRGIAILLVLAVHADHALPGGALGVDLFFVLSGFLITSLLLTEWDRDSTISLGSFYRRRAFRLLPALVVMLAVVSVVAVVAADDVDGQLVWVLYSLGYVINVAGHRLSTGAIEEVLAAHPDVAECAVFGVADDLKGEVPCGLVVLKAVVARPEAEVRAELIASVRHEIGPVAAFRLVTVVQRLPKTRSGKILRGTMKSIADGTSYRMPATIDDPAILPEIEAALQRLGYAGGAGG